MRNICVLMDSIWSDPGPDRGWSWAILFATFLIRFCSHATQSFSTIMFPTIVASYDVSREIAAWPFTLRLTLRSFSAIFAAWLLKKYSVRKISHAYNVIQVVGYMVCFVGTYNIIWLHLGNGVLNGIGVGLMDACTIVTLNQYFVNRRVMANGVMYTSTTLSAMVQPPLTMLLLHQFEIRGTFLFYSAWAAQCFIGGFLMRPRNEKHFPSLLYEEETETDEKQNGQINRCFNDRKIFQESTDDSADGEKTAVENCRLEYQENDAPNGLKGLNGHHVQYSSALKLNGIEEFGSFEDIALEADEETRNGGETKNGKRRLEERNVGGGPETRNIVREVLEVIFNPVAVIILLVSTLLLPLSQVYALIIMDHAELEGMSEERAVWVVPVLYISELIVRVPMSWIIEKDYIHKRHWYTIIMAVLCVGFFAIAFTHDDYVLFFSSGLVGVYTCFMHCLRVVITVDYMGIETLALMHGLVSFLNGCTYLLVPKILGVLFSVNNNYKLMFLFLGTTNLLAILLWQFVDVIAKRKSITKISCLKK